MIPKPGGGERPVGIPTIRDRVVQTAAKIVLEPIFEAVGTEQLVAQVADLVLDLTLLPSRGGGASHRLNQVVRAHLQKAAVVLARLTHVGLALPS